MIKIITNFSLHTISILEKKNKFNNNELIN